MACPRLCQQRNVCQWLNFKAYDFTGSYFMDAQDMYYCHKEVEPLHSHQADLARVEELSQSDCIFRRSGALRLCRIYNSDL